MPTRIDDNLVKQAPELKSHYARYQASLANVESKAKDDLMWISRQKRCGHLPVVSMILMKCRSCWSKDFI